MHSAWRIAFLPLFFASVALAGGSPPGCEPLLTKKSFGLELVMNKLFMRAKTERHLRRDNSPNGVDTYENVLGPRFIERLRALTPEQHWVEMGVGEGVAIANYLADPSFPNKANVTAIGLRRPSKIPRAARKTIRILVGRYLEDLPRAELGQADLVSDVFGPFHYSTRPDLVLERELSILKAGGALFTHSPVFSNLELVRADGTKVELADWLKSITGARLIESPRSVDGDGARAIELVRTSDAVAVPRLELIDFEAGLPPRRKYLLKDR